MARKTKPQPTKRSAPITVIYGGAEHPVQTYEEAWNLAKANVPAAIIDHRVRS